MGDKSTVLECIDCIQEYVISKTNNYLSAIQDSELPLLQSFLHDRLDEIIKWVGKTKTRDRIQMEKNLVDCKMNISQEIANIKSWFRLSKDTEWVDFYFDELIELTKEIGKKTFTDFELANINVKNGNRSMICGKMFEVLSDVILILQNNALTHSGYSDDLNNLSVTVGIEEKDDSFLLQMSNNLNLEGIEVDRLDAKILEINTYYEQGEYKESHLHQEGGKGLYKVINMLFFVLKIGRNFSLRREVDMFHVEIEIKKEGVFNEKNTVS